MTVAIKAQRFFWGATACVAQASKPAVSPTSQSAALRSIEGVRRFGNLRHSRLGSLRYFVFIAISAATPLAVRAGLLFDGTSQYVTFGPATNLGSASFTLETWFNWSGGGVPANTGNGGGSAIPLISKLSAEADGDARDGNYFLGIRPDGFLLADMEEGATGAVPGLNHPIAGVTAITPHAWHQAAVTYDQTNWVLYLDGRLESVLTVGRPPRWDSIQHAAIASSLNSTGAPQGFFSGMVDEVRIWNYARPASAIASDRYVQIPSAPGLIGRWSLDETNGLIAHDTSEHGPSGTLVNGPLWVSNQRAADDVVTPIKLTAVDPDRTAALRRTEAERIPPIFRFDPGIADEVEKSFRTSFLLTREKFLATLQESMPQRQPDSLDSGKLTQTVAAFQSTNKGFPVDLSLAKTWAQAKPDARMQADLVARVRQVMSRSICPDLLPNEAKQGPPNVRLFTLGLGDSAPEIDVVQAQSLTWSRTNLWPLSKARIKLRPTASTISEPVSAYLASLIRENCLFDGDLTRQSRARHVDTLFAADHYEPGQLLVRRGQIIDNAVRAALDELKKQSAADEVKRKAESERATAEGALQELRQRTAISEFKSEHFSRENRWLFGGLLTVAIASSIAVWQLARSRRPQTLLPAPVSRTEGPEAGDWRGRALIAEKQVVQTSEAIRAGLLPHLAEWLKSKFVRGLLAQRSHLINTQENAEMELAELEGRLARLHAPMEERLSCYRQRIVELERELAAKGQENREIIQAKIALTRKRLEAEQQKPVEIEKPRMDTDGHG